MEAALKAISEPNRQRILRLVREREMTAGDIASHFAVSGPAVSQHLKVLKRSGLIEERRDGTRRLYSLRREGLVEVRDFVESLWAEGLDRLRYAAEAEQRRKDRLGSE